MSSSPPSPPLPPPRPGCNDNGNYNGGYNPNYPGGYNPNYAVGYNHPNNPGGFNHNQLYNGIYNSNYHGNVLPQNSNPVETVFMKYIENWFTETFSNVHNLVLAFKAISKMMSSTLLSMKCIFRIVLSAVEKFEQLSNIFGQICQAVRLYTLFRWLYVKLMNLLGCKVPLSKEEEEEATKTKTVDSIKTAVKQLNEVIPYGLLAFFGVIVAGPLLISKMFLTKYEESCTTQKKWEHPGFFARVVKDFQATAPTEMSLKVNDFIVVAPRHVQNEMNVDISKLAFAKNKNGCSGIVPLNNLEFKRYE